jgi:hypothetical protein
MVNLRAFFSTSQALQETHTSCTVATWFVVFKLSSLAQNRYSVSFTSNSIWFLEIRNCFPLSETETWWLYSSLLIQTISTFQFSVHNSFLSSAELDLLYEDAKTSSLFAFLLTCTAINIFLDTKYLKQMCMVSCSSYISIACCLTLYCFSRETSAINNYLNNS